MSKKSKKIIIAIISVMLAAALITGITVLAVQHKKKAEAQLRIKTIASLEEPDFDSSLLEANMRKPDFDALQTLLSENRCVTWLFAGDSITQGCMHTGYWQNFEELFEKYIKLSAENRKNDIVINTGVSSATTSDMKLHFDDWFIGMNADVVFIGFGTNDSCLDGMTPEIFRENIIYAIHTLRENGIIPILQTPNVNSRQEPLKPYIEQMRIISEEENVLLIDVNKLWEACGESVPFMNNDGLHPNAAGHVFWCRFLLKSLGMYSENSELAKLSLDKIANDYSCAENQPKIEINSDIQSALQPYISNDKQVVWTFVGGAETQGLSLPYHSRGYVDHFNEAVRWEAASQDLNLRCKTIINSARDGYLPNDIYENYNELIGRFNSDVVVYMPELSDDISSESLKSGGEFYDSLMALAERVSADGAKLVILTNPAISGEAAELLKTASADACKKANGTLIDTASLLSEIPWNTNSADSHFALARAIVMTICELPDDSRMR